MTKRPSSKAAKPPTEKPNSKKSTVRNPAGYGALRGKYEIPSGIDLAKPIYTQATKRK